MVHAIWAVGRSAVIFSLAVATRVLAYFAASPPGGAPPQAFPTLTDREREILYLIARGHPNPSIARELSLSTKIVRNGHLGSHRSPGVSDTNKSDEQTRTADLLITSDQSCVAEGCTEMRMLHR
jgi:Bacterial regulatory proteins, luxR family